MASCEGCGSKVGCDCPESLEEDLERIQTLEEKLRLVTELLESCIGAMEKCSNSDGHPNHLYTLKGDRAMLEEIKGAP